MFQGEIIVLTDIFDAFNQLIDLASNNKINKIIFKIII